jgi:hypothetical protein
MIYSEFLKIVEIFGLRVGQALIMVETLVLGSQHSLLFDLIFEVFGLVYQLLEVL